MTRPAVRLSDALRRRIVDHCLSSLPNEGCGLMAMDQDEVVEVYPTENLDRSPVSFTVSPAEHYAALIAAEARGWELGGVFHSHPRGPAELSATDLDRALESRWLYLVVDLSSAPVLRAWRVDSGVSEVRLT